MKPELRDMLLGLWKQWPDTKPPSLSYGRTYVRRITGFGNQNKFTSPPCFTTGPALAIEARDDDGVCITAYQCCTDEDVEALACDAIERAIGETMAVREMQLQTPVPIDPYWRVRFDTMSVQVSGSHTSKLGALIACAHTVRELMELQ